MAKAPSFDDQIEKTKADARNVQDLSSGLGETLGLVPESAADGTYESERSLLASLRTSEALLESNLVACVYRLEARTNEGYAAFERIHEPRPEGFLSFLTRQKSSSVKTVRVKTLAVVEMLKTILRDAAVVHSVVQAQKDHAAALLAVLEPKLVASMEQRRKVVSQMDEARQSDKSLAASLATIRRKIATTEDETRLNDLKDDEEAERTQHDAVLLQRKTLAGRHDVLDRQAVLLGDFIDLTNDKAAVNALLLNKLTVEAERCIQLYEAAFGSLEPLLAEAQPTLSGSEQDAAPAPLRVFRDLLLLHGQGAVTMKEIESRSKRVNDALSRRREIKANGGV